MSVDKMNEATRKRAIEECEAMVEYALANGRSIPPAVLSMLEMLKIERPPLSQRFTYPAGEEPDVLELYTRSPAAGVPSESELTTQLAQVHNQLSAAIEPATPAAVTLLRSERQKKSFWSFLGPVPLVRKMMVMTLLSLVVFLSVFISPEVNAQSISGNILTYAPVPFLLNELFIIAIAALGASFFALFEAYRYVTKGSFDPTYESIYWIRFVLGVVSGVILSQFINVGLPAEGATNAQDLSAAFGRPLLAFLGGFSARVVHKILNSLVDSVETFISGSTKDVLRAREEAAKVRLEEEIGKIRREFENKQSRDRMDSVMKLMNLQEQINDGATSETVKGEIKQMVNSFMEEATPTPPTNNFEPLGSTTAPIYNPSPETYMPQDNIYTPNDNAGTQDPDAMMDDFADYFPEGEPPLPEDFTNDTEEDKNK